jgi:hypothetical protein
VSDTVVTAPTPSRRYILDWIAGVFVRPRKTFADIAGKAKGTWLTPLLLLSITEIAAVLVAGPIKIAIAQMQGPNLPPDYQYFTPEDQERFLQAAQATQGPVFIYVFPSILALGRVWFGWLLVGGMLHLFLTMLGGRGNTGTTMNLVAWGGLPFAIRDLVRIISMLVTHQIINHPGVTGFAPAGDSGMSIFLNKLFAYFDFYLLWHIILLVVGVRVATGLGLSKTWTGTLITFVIVLSLQALIGYLASLLGGLTVVRPFLF